MNFPSRAWTRRLLRRTRIIQRLFGRFVFTTSRLFPPPLGSEIILAPPTPTDLKVKKKMTFVLSFTDDREFRWPFDMVRLIGISRWTASMNDDGGDDGLRSVRHRGKHHKTAPADRWPAANVDDGRPGSMVEYHRRQHDMLVASRNDTATAARTSAHVLHAAPASMCYTTNEVLVIIAVTCFLNFAFILLIMTCVHCFTDPSNHKK